MTLSAPEIVARMIERGLVAIIRASTGAGGGGADTGSLVRTCGALAEGGVDICEITMTTPGALEAIAAARQALGEGSIVGVGSVLDAATARAAILAGAQFVVSPVTDAGVMETGHRYGLPVIPGALTPTEVLAAFSAGADLVKVFPANHFGPQYLKDSLAPMPQLRLLPTGGVNLQTIEEWVGAGAACLGVGTSLVKKELIAARDWPALTDLAGQYVRAVREARGARGQSPRRLA